MIKNYFKIAIRNLWRNKLYAVINTTGLALGLTVSFIIFSWVFNELNYDKFNKDYKRIYRLVLKNKDGSGFAAVSPAAKTQLLENISEVEYSSRVFRAGFVGEKTKVAHGNRIFTNDEIIYADPDFFHVFSFPLLSGNRETVLEKPNAVVITEKTAEKYFGDIDPVGKILLFSDKIPLEVTGVFKNLPAQSHFHFDVLVNIKSHPWGDISKVSLGSGWVFNTYMKLYPGASLQTITDKIDKLLYDYLPASNAKDYQNRLQLQPLKDIHLKSQLKMELAPNNDIKYIYLFSTIAVLVLIIAGINYVNLATVSSMDRSLEAGIRKVLGAARSQLFFQYLGESVILIVTALFLALILIELCLPLISLVSGFEIGSIFRNFMLIIPLIGFTIIFGLISGLFPAITFTSFKPVRVLKGKNLIDKKDTLRKTLVVFQFSVSLILLICTGIIYRQLQFIRNKNLGYDKDHVIILHIGYPELRKNYSLLKNELRKDPSVISATFASQLPTDIITSEGINTDDNKYYAFYTSIDPDFFKTMGIPILAGKENINNLSEANFGHKYVVNESTLKELGWNTQEALNREIVIRHGDMKPGPVIGVVKDFNFQSLHNPVNPLVFEFVPNWYEYLLIRISSLNTSQTLKSIKARWNEFAGGIPFNYNFLDQEYDRLYKSETRTGNLFVVFAIISSLIAMMGLFGLASYAVFKRTKEIGIRKVFGASSITILKLLNGDFAQLVLIAFIISIPVSWYMMHKWLENFTYKTKLSWWVFILSGTVIILSSIITISFHSWKAARKNPVETLRYE